MAFSANPARDTLKRRNIQLFSVSARCQSGLQYTESAQQTIILSVGAVSQEKTGCFHSHHVPDPPGNLPHPEGTLSFLAAFRGLTRPETFPTPKYEMIAQFAGVPRLEFVLRLLTDVRDNRYTGTSSCRL